MGVAKEGGPGTPNPIPLKIIKDKTRTDYACVRIRLIELNNLHNIHRTPAQSKILATPLRVYMTMQDMTPRLH